MNQIPCITTKCICYPVCKHKIRIFCPELTEYFEFLCSKHNNGKEQVWKNLAKGLPRLVSVQESTVKRFGEYEP